LRVEIGPRDLAEGKVTLVWRNRGEKQSVQFGEAAAHVRAQVEVVQSELLARATEYRDEHTVDCNSLDDIVDAAQTGFARAPWSVIGDEGEATLAQSSVTVRCLQ